MKVLLQKLSLIYFKLLRSFLLIIPENVKVRIGRAIGFVMMHISRKRKKITIANIENSSLNLSANEKKNLLKESYYNLGITLVELLTIDKYDFNKENSKFVYSNIELITEVKKKGRGVILLSGHFGNWELLAYSAGKLLGLPLNIIVKYQMNPFTDKYLRGLRQRGGNKLINMKNAGLPIVKLLRSNSIIAMLFDQRPGKNESIDSTFLGRITKTYKAPAMLALKFNTPLIVGFAARQPDNTYRVDLVELDYSDLENNSDGIAELTNRYNQLLESAISKNPGLWAWQHNRWKN